MADTDVQHIPQKPGAHPGLISTLASHPLAANLLMLVCILAGIWGLRQLNVQLNPTQPTRSIEVELTWPGAAAEDVEQLVTQPVEHQLRSLPGLESLTSTTQSGAASIRLRFSGAEDISAAADRVKQRVDQARDLPADLETPVIRQAIYYETVAAILLSSDGPLSELVPEARRIQRDLLARGLDQVEFRGVPREEIAIQIDSQTLFELGVPLHDIAASVLRNNRDISAGTVGSGASALALRAPEQRRSPQELAKLPLQTGSGAQLQRLDSIALIERRYQDNQRLLFHDGDAAIMIRARRAPDSDVMAEAQILREWHAENVDSLAARGIDAGVWLEAWRFARDTLMLVVNNGITGLFLVVAILFLFLNTRVAAWVTLGIPVSFLTALCAFWYLGGSINFISLVGAVMAIGIVVDDAIVVGEHALARFEAGASPAEAAASGARRMFAPVVASSLTTLAAFLPLVVLDQASIREIPLLIFCIIIASLFECFLILPGHLRHSFERMQHRVPGKFRRGFDHYFQCMVSRLFRPGLHWCLDNRRTVVAVALGAFVVALSLLFSGRVKPELDLQLNFEFADAHVRFAPHATEADKESYLRALETALQKTDDAFGGNVVITQVRSHNWARLDQQERHGAQYAAVEAELVSPEDRQVTLADFSAAWKQRVAANSAVEQVAFSSGEDSTPDLQLFLRGDDTQTLKAAAEQLAAAISQYPGVTHTFDDLPYGDQQWLFSLTAEGRAAGLSSEEVGRQVTAAFQGHRVQLFMEGDAELEIRVSLPESERRQPARVATLPIVTPDGHSVPLASIATLESQRGIDRIRHRDGQRVVNVYANVDRRVNTPMTIIADLEAQTIPEITHRYGVQYGLGDGSAEEARVLGDMLIGAVIGLILIYLILAWMFASWSWPLAVMVAIPLGFTGALFGLQIMGLNLGAMAIMGLFTLTGVIINDSIILINSYRELREGPMTAREALVEACVSRLRPVLLTSITTTLGLAPMMLESSPMGEAMAPIAVVICFGLMYGTALILIAIPAILSLIDRPARQTQSARNPTTPTHVPLPGYYGE
ncbi:multidrug efflux pump subunit AcrB [Chromatocurvus halotolerans]|uniref:Multidrug efflux pump subunit AcrB n=2 Tax=Chromatocurvus halotolerans TaxID=1132028 RepID=A0A4R2L9R4_9GAMM|nr:multidrug efflux pump subunit AcrB [Chromatocurvus halotolerans]